MKRPAYCEKTAQTLLAQAQLTGDYDPVIIHCCLAIGPYLANHKWAFMSSENYDDIGQVLAIKTMGAIKSYSGQRDVKLMTWLWEKYRYACLDFAGRKGQKGENSWMQYHTQLDPELDLADNLIESE